MFASEARPTPQPPRRKLRALLRGSGWTLLAVIGLLVLAGLSLLLTPVRKPLLSEALRQASARLPGKISVEDAAWPRIGRLEISGLVWTVDTDTLLVVRSALLDLDASALVGKEFLVHELHADILRADVPRLQAALADPDAAQEPAPSAEAAFFDRFALPELPSLALGHGDVRIDRIDLAGDSRLTDARLVARADLRHDRPWSLAVDTLTCATQPATWAVTEGRLSWDQTSRLPSARIRGRIAPDRPLQLDIGPETPETFVWSVELAGPEQEAVELSGTGEVASDPAALHLTLAGLVGPAELKRASIDLPLTDRRLRTLDLDLLATARGLALAARARIVRDDSLVVELAPLVLSTAASAGAAEIPAGAAAGRVVLHPERRRITVAGVRVTGDLGELRLDGRWTDDHGDVTVSARLPGPADLPDSLRPTGVMIDDLGDITLNLTAAVKSGSAGPVAQVSLDLGATTWIERGRLRGRVAADGFRLEELDFALPGLRLKGHGRLDAAGADLTLDAALPDSSFTRRFASWPPGLEVSRATVRARAGWDSLAMAAKSYWDLDWTLAAFEPSAGTVDLAGTGRVRLEPLSVRVTARGEAGPLALKHAGVRLEAPGGLARPFDVGLRVAANDLDLVTRGRVVLGDSVVLDLAPISVYVDTASTLADRRAGQLVAHAVVGPGARPLSVAGLRVDGDLGQLTLDGGLRAGRMTADLDLGWKRRPDVLLHLAGLDSLRWPEGEPYSLTASFRGEAPADSPIPDRGDLTAVMRLPGPAQLPPSLLPPDLSVTDLGPITARVAAHLVSDAAQPELSGTLDLADTDWIEAGELAVVARQGAVRIDSLEFRMRGLAVTAHGRVDSTGAEATATVLLPDAAFTARLPGIPAGLSVPRLELTGDTQPGSFAARLTAPDGVRFGENEWTRAEAAVSGGAPATAADSVAFRILAEGPVISLRSAGSVRAAAPLRAVVDTLELQLEERVIRSRRSFTAARDSAGTGWTLTGLDLDGNMGSLRAGGSLGPDSLDIDGALTLAVPVSVLRRLAPRAALPADPRLEFRLKADGKLGGTPAEPTLHAALHMGLQGDERLNDLDLGAMVDYGPGAKGAAPSLTGALTLDRGATRLIDGSAELPGTLALQPAEFVPSAVDSYRVELSTVPLQLEDFAALMPPGLSVRGVCEADVGMAGLGPEARLRGHFDAPKLRLDLSDGSWASMGGSVRFGGTTKNPAAQGSLTLDGGVIRIPEVPPALLPATGEAWLLDAPLAGQEPAVNSAETPVAPAHESPSFRLGLKVRSPGNLWLRGRGLAVELAGDLDITQDGLMPQMVGQMRAVRGSLKFLGRHFEVERGTVTFYGDLEDDPYLDLELASVIDGITYRIAVHGKAVSPELTLSSDPEMPEADIIASLLFGRPLDELDSGQESLLRQRTAQILAALGASRLADRLSGKLGADLVSYNQATGEDETASLMVGKYLNPRVLLKYEQQLGGQRGFFVRLDYMLSRLFRLETTVGQGSESGVELKWARDY